VNVKRVPIASKGHGQDEGLIAIYDADVGNKCSVQDRLQVSQIVRSKFR
jgi:hypothetical protein